MTAKKKKIIIIFGLFILSAGLTLSYKIYDIIYKANVKKDGFLLLPTNSNFSTLKDSLLANDYIVDYKVFERVSRLKKFETVKAGKYKLEEGMSSMELVNMLRSGNQSPVTVTFNNIRTVEQLAGRIAPKIEEDSAGLAELFNDKEFIHKYGFDKQTLVSMFIPNSYEFYWNTSAQDFFERMYKEYDKFWTQERIQKAKEINLTPVQVSVLASIVQAEQSQRNDEKAKIAGLYINRLKKGMLLESDPTLVYALGDFTKKRLLSVDKEIESPYNTYKYAGLPPGPINMPEISSLEAVLNYEKHEYIFMCAKEDFSGYHYFSTNLRQHEIYAQRYRNALNKNKIWK